ncbi:MAG: hypothetical protein LM589_00915 [Thermosphaera sp.]|nr:hypothetical protein [Thermosphaera sp.]
MLKVLIEASKTLILSAIRKKLYNTILVAVLAPVLLAVVLFTIPDPSSLNYAYIDNGKPVFLVSSSVVSGDCYPATAVEGFVGNGSSGLSAIVLVVKAEAPRVLSSTGLSKQYNYSSGVVLPLDLYNDLGKPSSVVVSINGRTRNYTVVSSWGSNIVLLLDSELSGLFGEYACLTPRGDLFRGFLRSIERDLLSVSLQWMILLILAYSVIIYTAHRRVAESMRLDVRILVESGLSNRAAKASTAIALIILHALITLYISALGVVLVYTAWSLLGYILPLPPPTLRTSTLWILLLEVLLGVAVAYPASRSVVD